MTVEILDVEHERTEAWQQFDEQQKRTGTLPKGTYDGVLREVAIVRRKSDGSWVLRLIARTEARGQYVVSWQGLAEDGDDPWDLTAAQARSMRKFENRMGLPHTPEPDAFVKGLCRLLDESVTVKVSQTPVGQRAVFSRGVSGELVNGNGSHDVEQDAVDAHVAHTAHEKIIYGLSAARLGLAQCAEGCYELQQSKGWEQLSYDTLNEYLASPEVTLSRSEFFRLADIWVSYVLEGGIEPVRLRDAAGSKLEIPLPALKAGVVSAERAVADAVSMPRKDLRTRYAELVGNEPSERVEKPKPEVVPVDVARRFVVMLERVLAELSEGHVLQRPGLCLEIEETLRFAGEHRLGGGYET